ncbi:uncharacterized protein TNIN_192911 [Trichonephila inaurata madagascariensis]|uniref:Uncharacterized protein n=1 Tax=Trichonephila inaurata madagascariensis TaxID=2747483 RepID=A0A8X7C6V0_9ARAC|nr:uncharacterized protein TNIN_192911 [Trichonephila inaurata madagascariensis]
MLTLGPGVALHLIPSTVYDQIIDYFAETDSQESLPEFGSESYINESDDFSLYQGLGAFPSVEEEGESDIEDEDISDNIVPTVEPEKAEMHFNLAHFKDDSSESESDVFTEGLSFNKNSVPSPQNSNTKEKETPHEQRLSSSDVEDELMDFEILEESDIPSVK